MAEGGRGSALVLILTLILASLLSSVTADQSQISEPDEEVLLRGISLSADENLTISFSARSGTFWVEAYCGGDCRNLQLSVLDPAGTMHYALVTDTAFLRNTTIAGDMQLNLHNLGSDLLNVEIQASLPFVDSIGEDIASSSMDDLAEAVEFSASQPVAALFDSDSSNHGLADPLSSWINASMDDPGALYWRFDTSPGQVIELALIHSSKDLRLQLLDQDSGDVVMAELSTPSNTSSNSQAQRLWVTAVGETTWLSARSESPQLSFAARLAHHRVDDDSSTGDWPSKEQTSVIQQLKNDDTAWFAGSLGTEDEDVVLLNASGPHLWHLHHISTNETMVEVYAMVDGIWVPFRELLTVHEQMAYRLNVSFWTPEYTSLLRFTVNTTNGAGMWTMYIARSTFGDLEGSEDANGGIPWNQTAALEDLYTLEMVEGEIHSGWLSLSVYDGADTFLVQLDGWENSRFRIRLKLTADSSRISAEIIEMEWSDRSITANATSKVAEGDYSEIFLEVGPGMHLIRIRSVDLANELSDWSWGDPNVSSLRWDFEVDFIQTDEGDEPWFESKGFVSDVSDMLLLFLGFLLLLPLLIVIWTTYIHATRAKQLAGSRERLEALKKMLTEGRVKQARGDLAISLRSIASLEWEEGVSIWGTPDIRHRTENLDMALWRLHPGLARKGGRSVLLGIHVIRGTWEVAAVRFEVTSGPHWRVTRCQPRLLKRGDEVFLDSLAEGSRTFIEVELKGEGKGLELSLSGLIDQQPVAAKPSASLSFEEE